MSELLNGGHYTADGTADLEKFTDLIHDLLNAVWGSDWGVFTAESPTDNEDGSTTMPHITYNLVSRRIAKDRALKQQQFDSFPDPDNEGHNITLYRQWFDCVLEFDIYHSSNKEALRTAQRFEEFIETYRGYFKQQGVVEIIFDEELAPEVSTEYRQNIPHRTVRYNVRIERVSVSRSVHLKQVETIVEAYQAQESHSEARPEPTGQITTSFGDSGFLDVYNQHFPKYKGG